MTLDTNAKVTKITPKLVVITPVYEDAEASSKLFHELAHIFANDIFIVAVDDGSVRQPVDPAAIAKAGINGAVIRLKRNIGHQRAIAVGMQYAADHFADNCRFVVMDSDGEDIPASIVELMHRLDSPDVDIVVAQRKNRVETVRFKMFYLVYKVLFSLLTGRKISFGNFMALKHPAVKRLAAMQELWIHVAGSVLTSKLRIAICPLNRGARYAGQSKMNFVGLALHGFKGLMVFAEDVLVRVGIMCAVVACLSVLAASAAIVLKIVGYATPGWFSVAFGILVLVFLQTGMLALMTLLLTGVVRGGGANIAYQDMIDSILYVDSK